MPLLLSRASLWRTVLATALLTVAGSLPAQQGIQPLGTPAGLRIAFVNVQWGDGVIVVGPDGTCMVFDAGANGMGRQAMLPMLKKLGVRRVRYLLASHYHGDHIGGLDEILSAMPVDQVWDRGTRNVQGLKGSYASYVRLAGSRRKTVRTGQVFDLGAGAKATVIAYDGNVVGSSKRHAIDKTSNYENSASVVVRVDYGDFSCWLGGDLTGAGTRYDMETPVSKACGDVDVYLADHHGWDDGSNQNLLNTIKPEVCVISCSHKNTHNVPHRATLDRMSTRSKNRLVLSTTPGSGEPGFTSGGTMLLSTDGWRYRITAQSGGFVDLYTDEYKGRSPLPGDLVISEVHRSPSAFWGEYLELYNRSGSPLNLRDLEVLGKRGSFKLAAPYRLLPRRRILLTAHGDPTRNGGLPFAHSWPARSLFVHNESDELRLRHNGRILETLRFSRGFAGGQARSAERMDLDASASVANFKTARSRFGRGDYGSPLSGNSVATGHRSRLAVGVEQLSQAAPAGGALHFFESAQSWIGKYVVLGISSATSPGIKVGTVLIPLRDDALFRLVDGNAAFVGIVPRDGLRALRIPIPQSLGLKGLAAYCACYIYDPQGPPFIPASSAAQRFVFP